MNCHSNAELCIRVSKGPDKKVSLPCCPFVPGQKKFTCPAVPLSRDKKNFLVLLSLFPGTRAAAKIVGQTPWSLDVQGQNNCQRKTKILKSFFFSKFLFFTLLYLLSHGCPGIFRDGTGQVVKIPTRPVPWLNIKTLSRSTSRPRFQLAVPALEKMLNLSRCLFVLVEGDASNLQLG